MASPYCKEELLFKLGGKKMMKEWRHYRFKLNKANFLYFQLDEVRFGSYGFHTRPSCLAYPFNICICTRINTRRVPRTCT